MNKYFGSCWLHNGIVANAFCSLVKCIKRNVIIVFFIYIILVQIFKKFVYYDDAYEKYNVYKIFQRMQQSKYIKLSIDLDSIQ